MPFEIIRGDITEISTDAIVNTANPNPVIGSGVDAEIYKKANIDAAKEAARFGVSADRAVRHHCSMVSLLSAGKTELRYLCDSCILKVNIE